MTNVYSDQRAVAVMNYLTKLPAAVPAGQVLVHNRVLPTRRLGSRGFRAWLSPAPPDLSRLRLCGCVWAPELGPHFTPLPSSEPRAATLEGVLVDGKPLTPGPAS